MMLFQAATNLGDGTIDLKFAISIFVIAGGFIATFAVVKHLISQHTADIAALKLVTEKKADKLEVDNHVQKRDANFEKVFTEIRELREKGILTASTLTNICAAILEIKDFQKEILRRLENK